ncbi:MAG: sodium:solute symporter, partial [Bacteroidales bacterium]|nr:sodium:solute symporter [Bacteroidales bacterium]
LFTSYKVKDKLVPYIAIASPVICFFLSEYSEYLFFGNRIGFELLIINGLLTFTGLFLIKTR